MNDVHAMSQAAGLTETSNRARNDELYQLVITGDEQATKEMIESNMALVTLRVESFLAHFPKAAFLRDDMISEGLLALTQAVNSMRMNPVSDPNPTGYILVAVTNAIAALVDSELNMQVDGRTARDARAAGDVIPNQVPIGKDVFEIVYDDSATREFRDLIMSCAENDRERTILKMREEGYVLEDVAEAVGLKKSHTQRISQKLFKRVLEKSGYPKKPKKRRVKHD